MDQELGSAWGRNKSSSTLPDQVQESAWVAASQCGDTLAFNRLVLKWEQTVYNVALRMLQNRDEATEAAQEVFLLAYKNIRRFRQEAKFSTWLYRIAVNHCVSRARRRPSSLHVSLDSDDATAAPARQLRTVETQEGELLRSENRIECIRRFRFCRRSRRRSSSSSSSRNSPSRILQLSCRFR